MSSRLLSPPVQQHQAWKNTSVDRALLRHRLECDPQPRQPAPKEAHTQPTAYQAPVPAGWRYFTETSEAKAHDYACKLPITLTEQKAFAQTLLSDGLMKPSDLGRRQQRAAVAVCARYGK